MGDPTAAIDSDPMETTKQRLKHIVATLNQSRTEKKKKCRITSHFLCLIDLASDKERTESAVTMPFGTASGIVRLTP